MVKTYYLPTDDAGKADLLDHIAAKLPAYAEILGMDDTDIKTAQADAAAFRYTLSTFNLAQNNAKQWTAYKKLLRDGGVGNTSFPLAPSIPTQAPPSVPQGIIHRLTSLVSRIKAARNYTEVIGQDLAIVGTIRIVDPSTWKPVIEPRIEASHPIIRWSKGKADSLEIWVDRGTGFTSLAVTTDPSYTDITPPPSEAALWKYKAIYKLREIGRAHV